jgi:hypothetical protein
MQVVDYIINAVYRNSGTGLDDPNIDVREAFAGWEGVVLDVCQARARAVVTEPRMHAAAPHLRLPCACRPCRMHAPAQTEWHRAGRGDGGAVHGMCSAVDNVTSLFQYLLTSISY